MLSVVPSTAQANCSEKPSASTFFKFMKEIKKETHRRGDTLLKASAINKECKPVFELKILEASGRVAIRYYDAHTYEELFRPNPVLIRDGSDRSDSSSGSSGSSGGRGSSDRDDDDNDNDDDDDD